MNTLDIARRRLALYAAVLTALITFTGCAVYQFRLAEPVEHAATIDQEGMTFDLDPLHYHLYEHGSRLGLRISNPGSEPITLLGERSYLIDPEGETRAILGGTIGPHSYITEVLPPQVEAIRSGPRFGVGIGVGTGYSRIGVGGYHSSFDRYPSSVRQTLPIWRWNTGAVRLHLIYELADDRFAHELLVERERVR